MSKCRALSYTLGSGIFFPFIVRRVLPSVQYSSVFLFRTSPIPDRIAPEQKTTKKRQLEPTALSRKRRLDRALHQRRILQTDTHTTHREGHAPHNKKKVPESPPPPSLFGPSFIVRLSCRNVHPPIRRFVCRAVSVTIVGSINTSFFFSPPAATPAACCFLAPMATERTRNRLQQQQQQPTRPPGEKLPLPSLRRAVLHPTSCLFHHEHYDDRDDDEEREVAEERKRTSRKDREREQRKRATCIKSLFILMIIISAAIFGP